MIVEVDQSIKVEQTNRDTVIAFSNGEQFALLISARVKREAISYLQNAGRKQKRIYLWLFVLALYHLLKHHTARVSVIVIDVEYDGQEQNIKALLLQFLGGVKSKRPQIIFHSIGKKSNAHALAISIVRGERKANRAISLEEFLQPLVPRTKKRTGKPK